MQNRYKALFIVTILFGITLLAIIRLGVPMVDDTPPLKSSLPRIVGHWVGSIPLFCQNESCLYAITDFKNTIAPDVCPECGGELSSISLAELQILPEGTKISKMNYQYGYEEIFVSIVITGHQRSGIHRPQWCLPSQGLVIRHSQIIKHDIGLGYKLPINVLRVTPKGHKSGGGVFAYWFADKEHETATHWQRLYWMAYNDLILGVRRPWAYVSVWIPGEGDAVAVEKALSFIGELYPYLSSDESVNFENLD